MTLPDDMVIPQMRRDTTEFINVRWLLRNLPIINRKHPLLQETIDSLEDISKQMLATKRGDVT